MYSPHRLPVCPAPHGPLLALVGVHPLSLDPAPLPAGVYVVRAATAAGVATRTLVVAR